MKARIPCSASASRNAASDSGLPALNAQPRGFPTKICRVSQSSFRAVVNAPATRPLPTGTWVPIGLSNDGSPTEDAVVEDEKVCPEAGTAAQATWRGQLGGRRLRSNDALSSSRGTRLGMKAVGKAQAGIRSARWGSTHGRRIRAPNGLLIEFGLGENLVAPA